MEKTISYTSKNTYVTLNTITSRTKNVWFVFHGIGYLSKYFIKYFERLDADENYIVAPQAPSKYYLKNEYKYVGASWLTKENTASEIDNILNYVDAVFDAEQIPTNLNLILFGFSQGVSVVTRWMTLRKIECSALILYSGIIPKELKEDDFSYVNLNKTKIKVVFGKNDEFLKPSRLHSEKAKIDNLFNGKAAIIMFDGAHEIKQEVIKSLI
ncbi:MAG: esterase [Flavobacteriaceae bacterium]